MFPIACNTAPTCGREMSWRKSRAKNWDEVKYCSQDCRANKPATAKPAAVADQT
ncbi:DUF2256 domain-containing protein [Polaromonas sp.]|uniref:DUF2256 domain-containing protein n=1 Tax=Polaromonas sp. TaxID=1869339 RepID=UPI003524388C